MVSVDVGAVRAAGRRLGLAGAHLTSAAHALPGESAGWQGAAAVFHVSRMERLRKDLRDGGDRIGALGRATSVLAESLESAQSDHRRAMAAEESARRRIAAAAPRPGELPEERAVLAREREQASVDLAVALRMGQRAANDSEAARRRYAAAVHGQAPGSRMLTWDEMVRLAGDAVTAKGLFEDARLVASAVGIATEWRRWRSTGPLPRAMVQRLIRARELMTGKVPAIPRGLSWLKPASRLIPLLSLAGEAQDVITGGGYDDWRRHPTRLLAVVSGGSTIYGLTLVGTASPLMPLAIAGGALYSAWTAGNWVYDNRAMLERNAIRLWNFTKRKATEGWRFTKRKAEDTWRFTKRQADSGWTFTKRQADSGWRFTKRRMGVIGGGAVRTWTFIRDGLVPSPGRGTLWFDKLAELQTGRCAGVRP